jgi:hypothetical protein
MVVLAKIIDINPRDHNEVGNLAKRNGSKINGPHLFLNLVIEDDTDRLLARVIVMIMNEWPSPSSTGAMRGVLCMRFKGSCFQTSG